MRRIARIYGGRPGLLGGWRLLRLSLASVLASGALDLTDDAIGGALGAGIAARLSRRAGVGLLNGLLTARLAAAAMDLGRPFPWTEGRPPLGPAAAGRGVLADGAGAAGPAGRSGRRVTPETPGPEAGSVHIRAFPYRRSRIRKRDVRPAAASPSLRRPSALPAPESSRHDPSPARFPPPSRSPP